jgi:hypothetical protein
MTDQPEVRASSARSKTIAVFGIAMIAAGLALAGAWVWVIRGLAVNGTAWSLDAPAWLRGGRGSPLFFFVLAPVLTGYLLRSGYACVRTGWSDRELGTEQPPREPVEDDQSAEDGE